MSQEMLKVCDQCIKLKRMCTVFLNVLCTITVGIATVLGSSLETALEREAQPFLSNTNTLLNSKLSMDKAMSCI